MMLNDRQKAIQLFLSKPAPMHTGCACLGPRKGEPLCRCAMQYVEAVNGVWYKVVEHKTPKGIKHTTVEIGPVSSSKQE